MFSKVNLFASLANTLHTSAHEASVQSLDYIMQGMVVEANPREGAKFNTEAFLTMLAGDQKVRDFSSLIFALQHGHNFACEDDSNAIPLDTFLNGRKARISIEFVDEQVEACVAATAEVCAVAEPAVLNRTVYDIANNYQCLTATDVLNCLRAEFEAGGLDFKTALSTEMVDWFYKNHPQHDARYTVTELRHQV
jgi:hypothetical protein